MPILNIIGEIYLNLKILIKNIFLKFGYVFIKVVIGWNFNILNILCLIIFPSSTLSETDQKPITVKHKAMYILTYWTCNFKCSCILVCVVV